RFALYSALNARPPRAGTLARVIPASGKAKVLNERAIQTRHVRSGVKNGFGIRGRRNRAEGGSLGSGRRVTPAHADLDQGAIRSNGPRQGRHAASSAAFSFSSSRGRRWMSSGLTLLTANGSR